MSRVSKLLNSTQTVLMNTRSRAGYTLVNDTEQQIFYIKIGLVKGEVAYRKSDKTLDLYHSYVPPKLRGKGYGCMLAKEVFEYVAENNYRMKLTCPFLNRCANKELEKYKAHIV